MKKFLLGRLAWALPIVVLIVVVNFLLTRMVPGDPIVAIVGEYPVPAEYVAKIRSDLQLDQPALVQLVSYLGEIAKGNLGYSFVNRQSVLSLVLDRTLSTLALMVPALILATLAGLLLAKFAAGSKQGIKDTAVTGVTLFGYSVPVFWLGQVLIVLFAVQLQWFPAQGMFSMRGVEGTWGKAFDFVMHWILPGFCVAIFYTAVVARVGRASLEEAAGQDFVTTAQAKGLSERAVFWRHVLPNAFIPIVTVVGYNFGHALTGTIMVETVFAWPGLGTLFITSIANRDYPVVQGIFLLAATAVVLVNLLTDLLYGLLDPRIRRSYRAAH